MNYANRIGYTDVTPYEIVRRVSDRTLDVRSMSVERDPSWSPEFVPGGFCGTVVNQHSQRWVISSQPEGIVCRIRLGKQGWKDAHGNRYQLADQPVRFYDFNF